MECWEAQRLLDTFVDGYTDVPTSLDLQEHIEQCSRCQHELELEHRLRHWFTAPGAWEEAPAPLRRQIAGQLSGRRSPVRRLIAGGALVMLGLVFVLGLLRSVQPVRPQLAPLLEAATQTHQGLGNAVPSVRSTDAQHLHTALSVHFPYRFGVPQPARTVRLLGGTSCTLQDVPCRAAIYEHSGQRISYFVFPFPSHRITAAPQARLHNRTIYALRSGKYQVLFWPEGPVICALVADLAPHTLLPLARSAIASEAEDRVAG